MAGVQDEGGLVLGDDHPTRAEVAQAVGDFDVRADRHVARPAVEFLEQLGEVVAQGRDGHVAVVALVELGEELVDGGGRLVHDVAVGRDQRVGPGCLDSSEAFDQFALGSEEAVVVANLSIAASEALLQAVEVPDLAVVVDGVAAEDGLAAVDLDQVADRTVGVAGRVEHGDLGACQVISSPGLTVAATGTDSVSMR